MTSDKIGPVTLLKDSVAQLERDCQKYKDDYVRALADFDNYRRRVERDLEVSRRVALERLAMDLVPVMDNFDRAMTVVGTEKDVDGVRKGMSMIHRQLQEVLCRHGVEQFSCLGQEFDPRRAEAVGFVQSDEQAPNTVVHEECKGYACGERILRPARVMVVKSATQPAEAESGKDDDIESEVS